MLLTGCEKSPSNKEKRYEIPDENKFVFSENDTLIYKSNENLLDTFRIKISDSFLRTCNTDFNMMVWSEVCWYEEYCSIYIYNIKDSLGYVNPNDIRFGKSLFYLNLKVEKYTAYGSHTFEYCFGIYSNIGMYETSTSEQIQLENTTYNVNIYSITSQIDPPISRVYYNSNYGVLKYELENGNWWELQIKK